MSTTSRSASSTRSSAASASPSSANMRPGPKTRGKNMKRRRTTYDSAALLQGYVDPYDSELYKAAERRFWADVKAYGVDRESCARLCPRAKDVFALPATKQDEDSSKVLDFDGELSKGAEPRMLLTPE